ncbi:PHP domain-containing protein [Pelosinus baikalensis]|uniref:PHP domain-containing protein n=1 Tax=Pelosinus baikalensis TaxID=2892015 RepID=A0ABS8HN64_9FIRM|nr:PHP domain-containing protein [Pelosinus baikalensis]MCC5464640.1 PHP domain-containing protein [Pelosinus baikalensis]
MQRFSLKRLIKEQGGLVCVPHPFERLRKSAIENEALISIINDVDAIEVFNSCNIFDADDKAAMFFAKKYGNAVLVGSDCHSPYEVDIKQGTLRCQRSAMVVHIIIKWNKVACKFGL